VGGYFEEAFTTYLTGFAKFMIFVISQYQQKKFEKFKIFLSRLVPNSNNTVTISDIRVPNCDITIRTVI